MRKSCPCKFPGQLGHRALGLRAQRSHRGLPARVENYYVLWQGLLGHRQRPTGGGWHQPFSRKDPGGVMEKLRVALRGLSSEQRILQNKGGFAKRQLRGEAVPYSGFGEERNHTHEKTDPETGWPRPNPTSATN